MFQKVSVANGVVFWFSLFMERLTEQLPYCIVSALDCATRVTGPLTSYRTVIHRAILIAAYGGRTPESGMHQLTAVRCDGATCLKPRAPGLAGGQVPFSQRLNSWYFSCGLWSFDGIAYRDDHPLSVSTASIDDGTPFPI